MRLLPLTNTDIRRMWQRLQLIPCGRIATVLLCFFLATNAAVLCRAASADETEPASATAGPYHSPTNGLGSWVWAEQTFNEQTCQFWKTFVIPAGSTVTQARLVMTVDNEFTVFLDGRELGRGAEWRELFIFDLGALITPGTHVLAVRAFNSATAAGMLLGLQVYLADGRRVEIQSDQSWRIVPNGVKGWEKRTVPLKDWPPVTIKAPLGGSPWWQTPVNINIMHTLQPIRVYFWQTAWFQIALLSVFGLVILISLRLVAQIALHRKEQWLLQQERARIARDFHDDLGSRMTRLVLHGEVAQSELPAHSRTRLQLDQICEQARGILSTMDEILWAVSPKRDTYRDFTSFVCGYAQDFLKSSHIQCLFDLDPAADVVLNLPLKRTLLMVVKEALNNVIKHSQATEVVIAIKVHAQKMAVIISDNGKGFDPAAPKQGRNGLANMTQRMDELDGACKITSQPGKGCRTEFIIPLPRGLRPGRSWVRRWNGFVGRFRRTRKPLTNDKPENEPATEI